MVNQLKKAELGQIFTPLWMVQNILDTIDYKAGDKSILSKTVLEPSVGEGIFLQEIVRRLLQTAREERYTDEEIQVLLESNIHGVDVDPDLVFKSIENLHDILAENDFHLPVQWSVTVQNAIQEPPEGVYDVIVGNPPYVRLIPESDRVILRQLRTQQGALNLYTAFFELGLTHWISDTGVLAYIAPNTWVKNASTRELRKLMMKGQHIREIIDYSAVKVFEEEAETYTAVTVLTKQPNEDFVYRTMLDESVTESNITVPYSEYAVYSGEPLVVHDVSIQDTSHVMLQDICNIQTGAQLSGVKIFVNPNVEIESDCLIPAARGNAYKGGVLDTAIFPYGRVSETDLFGNTVNTSIKGLTENEMQQYPLAYDYLLSYYDKLSQRNLGKGSLWFHYGRNQGLEAIFEQKLVLSPVLSKEATQCEAYPVDTGVLVYSGLIITMKDPQYSLDMVRDIIQSPEFVQYAWNHAPRDISGGYRVFNAGNVRNFYIPKRYLTFQYC